MKLRHLWILTGLVVFYSTASLGADANQKKTRPQHPLSASHIVAE